MMNSVQKLARARISDNAFIRNLSRFVELTSSLQALIDGLTSRIVHVDRSKTIVASGDQLTCLYVVRRGWAGRYGLRADGSRRITGFMLPGDFCGIHAATSAKMDHSITAITPCIVSKIEWAEVEGLIQRAPAISTALWRAKLVDEATLRKWLLRSGDALKSAAHLLSELHARAESVQLTNSDAFEMPLKQGDLADALGITAVHTNRVLQSLRRDGLIVLEGGILRVPDVAALRHFASFDPSYLL